MAKKNEALEAALEMVGSIPYRMEETRDRHIKLMIEGAKKIVYISSAAKGRDKYWVQNVRQDVRHAIRSINHANP